MDKFNWYQIIYSSNIEKIDDKHLEQHIDSVPWSTLASCCGLSKNQMDKFFDKINWDQYIKFVKNVTIPHSILMRIVDTYTPENIDWIAMSRLELNDDFLSYYKDKIEWSIFSRHNERFFISHPNLFEFLKTFKDYIDWDHLCSIVPEVSTSIHSNPPPLLTVDMIKYFHQYIVWGQLSSWCCISEEIAEEFPDYINWEEVSFHPLNVNFIRKFKDRLDWSGVCYQSTMSEDFIREHIEYIHWPNLSGNLDHISESFLDEYSDKLDWGELSYMREFSEDFARKYVDKIHWSESVPTPHFSSEFIMELKLKGYI